MWLLRELLLPIELTAEALRNYIDSRALPDLPVHFPDRAGRLMEGTQYTLTQLHETITRLERASDIDDLTGVYNRRAGEKRLSEEVARAERDLQAFQLAFLDINDFKAINDEHGHSAGDAAISHVAALLQLNVRRGDWVARWGGDEFVVGLHRNRALRMVMSRIVKAIDSSPCEMSPGREVPVHVSCGVAEYRFGGGAEGVLADADRAMYAAKELARLSRESHICYRTELDMPREPKRDPVSAD
jgi:diguanylate cyclase (GGDEF)-like protein